LGATRRLAQKETRGQSNSEKGKQSEKEYRVQSNPTMCRRHTLMTVSLL
jgi:hypothetical protein